MIDNLGGTTLTQSLISKTTCSNTPVISQTRHGLKSKLGNFANVYFQGTTYNGPALDKVCRIDIGLTQFSGNIATKTFTLEVNTLNNDNNLTTPKGSVAVTGSVVPESCAFVSFTFEAPVSLASGDAITVNMNGSSDSSNYASACANSFNNAFTDGAAATWHENGSLQSLSSGGTDLMLQVFTME